MTCSNLRRQQRFGSEVVVGRRLLRPFSSALVGAVFVLGCQAPDRLETERAAADNRAPREPDDAAPLSASAAPSERDASAAEGAVACTRLRSVEFTSQHSRMSDLRVSVAAVGVYFGHGSPGVSSMLSRGGWDDKSSG